MQWRSAEQFEVSPLTSGLTPWGHTKKNEHKQPACLTLEPKWPRREEEGEGDEEVKEVRENDHFMHAWR